MSLPLMFGCAWVLLATFVAALPMRRQFPPGIALLIAAPVILSWIAWEHGFWIFGAGLIAFISMFRHPLRYFLRRTMRDKAEISS
ncbi:MAG: DUF2484 family protein [Boseongicola sp.]